MKPSAITVCVEFSDILAITLPRNAKHFERIVVVSSFADEYTPRVVATIPNAELFQTNDFYLDGAVFNKGRALESGFDVLGRRGWICVLDADIVLPRNMNLAPAQIGNLHTPRRRMLADISRWPEVVDNHQDWDLLPRQDADAFPGYFQLFHADDPVLKSRPWYETNWRHAGGADSMFSNRWSPRSRVRPPFEVLHLGEDGKNWCGRATEFVSGSLHPQAGARAAELAAMLAARDPDDKLLRSEKL